MEQHDSCKGEGEEIISEARAMLASKETKLSSFILMREMSVPRLPLTDASRFDRLVVMLGDSYMCDDGDDNTLLFLRTSSTDDVEESSAGGGCKVCEGDKVLEHGDIKAMD
jgi:hypothetical protein